MGGSDEYFPTENVEWDKLTEGAPMARFVGDGYYVEPTERTPFGTDEIKTPKIQERRIIGEGDIKKRSLNENIYSPKTEAQRAADLHADDLKFCLNSIDNRIEVMCSDFITKGRIAIEGIGVHREIDYMLPHREALATQDSWGKPGVSILSSIKQRVRILKHLGKTVDELIMSPEVWEVVNSDSEIQKLLDIRNYEFGNFKPEQVSKYGAAEPVGMLSSPRVTLYTHDAEYGPKNNRQRQLPIGMVIFGTPDSRKNKLGYGAYTYMDENENWVTVSGRYVQEFFKQRRPPKEEVLATSRAVPIPYDIESWYILQVF
jgi:hypothetical protein